MRVCPPPDRSEQHGVATVVARKKPDITNTAPEPILDDLRLGCDIVVTGVGDCGSCSASAVADGIILEHTGNVIDLAATLVASA